MMVRHMRDLKRAIAGEIGMSDELDSIGSTMFNGFVPSLWKDANTGFSTLKPLASWTEDL